MADNRTEKATPKRRDEARKKGQMARSADLNASLVLIAAIAALAITGPAMLSHLADIVRQGLAQAGHPELGSRAVLTRALYVGGAFALIGVIDFGWQRRQYEKGLRMTKEEVKQEGRQSDLAPEVRSAIRRRQYAQARKRMIADVATADVVVTN